MPEIQIGTDIGSTVYPSGETDIDVIFKKEFSDIPSVIVAPAGTNGSASTAASIHTYPSSISRTGFTIRVLNNSSSNINIAIRWIAIYAK